MLRKASQDKSQQGLERLVMDTTRPPRKRDLLVERGETGGAGMEEVTGARGWCVSGVVGKDQGL